MRAEHKDLDSGVINKPISAPPTRLIVCSVHVHLKDFSFFGAYLEVRDLLLLVERQTACFKKEKEKGGGIYCLLY